MLLCICNGTSTSDIRNVMAESETMMNDGGMGEQVRWPLLLSAPDPSAFDISVYPLIPSLVPVMGQ